MGGGRWAAGRTQQRRILSAPWGGSSSSPRRQVQAPAPLPFTWVSSHAAWPPVAAERWLLSKAAAETPVSSSVSWWQLLELTHAASWRVSNTPQGCKETPDTDISTLHVPARRRDPQKPHICPLGLSAQL